MEEKKRYFSRFGAASMLMIAALLMTVTIEAQTQNPVQVTVPVTISGEKTVAEGKVYYIHQVQKGQTLYSIARPIP